MNLLCVRHHSRICWLKFINATLVNRVKAMMPHAHVSVEYQYKLFQDYYETVAILDELIIVNHILNILLARILIVLDTCVLGKRLGQSSYMIKCHPRSMTVELLV